MNDGFSCYYLCLVGVLPNELYCKSAGGCENCKFYLKDPAPKEKEEGRMNREIRLPQSCPECGGDCLLNDIEYYFDEIGVAMPESERINP